MLKEVVAKVDPHATPQSQAPLKREMVEFMRLGFKVAERRACRQLGFWQSTQRHSRPREGKNRISRARLRLLALEWPRFGYRRLQVLLKKAELTVDHKRVYRIYPAKGSVDGQFWSVTYKLSQP